MRTDDKGEFLIKDLKEGDYTVIIESPGFKRQQIMQIKIKSGRLDLGCDFVARDNFTGMPDQMGQQQEFLPCQVKGDA